MSRNLPTLHITSSSSIECNEQFLEQFDYEATKCMGDNCCDEEHASNNGYALNIGNLNDSQEEHNQHKYKAEKSFPVKTLYNTIKCKQNKLQKCRQFNNVEGESIHPPNVQDFVTERAVIGDMKKKTRMESNKKNPNILPFSENYVSLNPLLVSNICRNREFPKTYTDFDIKSVPEKIRNPEDILESAFERYGKHSNNCTSDAEKKHNHSRGGDEIEQRYDKEMKQIRKDNTSNRHGRDSLKHAKPKFHKSTLITNSSSEEAFSDKDVVIDKLYQRIEDLEKIVLKKEYTKGQIKINDYDKAEMIKNEKPTKDDYRDQEQPCCSYSIQKEHRRPSTGNKYQSDKNKMEICTQYNHATNLNKINQEIKVRNKQRYQSASSPIRNVHENYRQDEFHRSKRTASARTRSPYHGNNTLRDFRLMDTIHYLAQGEFNPRNDGIKLTPSREAVLSDIIWEDVCRTHWPDVSISRRTSRYQVGRRIVHRNELQRHIDCLLRNRSNHMERKFRRRQNDRTVLKMNEDVHSHNQFSRSGQIIVADQRNVFQIRSDCLKPKDMLYREHNLAKQSYDSNFSSNNQIAEDSRLKLSKYKQLNKSQLKMCNSEFCELQNEKYINTRKCNNYDTFYINAGNVTDLSLNNNGGGKRSNESFQLKKLYPESNKSENSFATSITEDNLYVCASSAVAADKTCKQTKETSNPYNFVKLESPIEIQNGNSKMYTNYILVPAVIVLPSLDKIASDKCVGVDKR